MKPINIVAATKETYRDEDAFSTTIVEEIHFSNEEKLQFITEKKDNNWTQTMHRHIKKI